MEPRVSFVLPAFDEEQMIGAALDALTGAAAQLEVSWEIVVADDASTDRTAEIAAGRGARVVSVAHRQIAATRNSGAREARGEYLVFVDADTLVTPEVVHAAVEALDGGAVGGGGSVRFDEPIPLWARLAMGVFVPLYRWIRMAPGCFLFARRDDFEAVGGFNERLFGGEEVDLSMALRRRGRFVLLREYVVSSGRKLRLHSAGEIFGVMFRFLLGGRRAAGRRHRLWYGERRPDPGLSSSEVAD